MGTRRRRAGRALVLIALGVSCLTGGCNVVGPAAVLIHGPEKVKRLHELDPKRSTVVFVDDRASAVPQRVLRQRMAEVAQNLLLEKRVLTDVIDAKAVMTLTAQDKSGSPLSIAEVGQAVGADVVVYVTIDEFTLSPDGQTFQPGVAMRAKVVDVSQNARVWPEDRAGYAFRADLPIKQGTAPTDTGTLTKARLELAEYAGRAIAELFYDVDVAQSTRMPASRRVSTTDG